MYLNMTAPHILIESTRMRMPFLMTFMGEKTSFLLLIAWNPLRRSNFSSSVTCCLSVIVSKGGRLGGRGWRGRWCIKDLGCNLWKMWIVETHLLEEMHKRWGKWLDFQPQKVLLGTRRELQRPKLPWPSRILWCKRIHTSWVNISYPFDASGFILIYVKKDQLVFNMGENLDLPFFSSYY